MSKQMCVFGVRAIQLCSRALVGKTLGLILSNLQPPPDSYQGLYVSTSPADSPASRLRVRAGRLSLVEPVASWEFAFVGICGCCVEAEVGWATRKLEGVTVTMVR